MIQYLLSKNGKFYKTCLHSHTTDSDGKLSPKEKKDMYKSHGYSVLALTDHELMVDHRELNDEDFLILQGYEFAINKGSPYIYSTDCHLNIFPTDENEFRMICYNPSYCFCFNKLIGTNSVCRNSFRTCPGLSIINRFIHINLIIETVLTYDIQITEYNECSVWCFWNSWTIPYLTCIFKFIDNDSFSQWLYQFAFSMYGNVWEF